MDALFVVGFHVTFAVVFLLATLLFSAAWWLRRRHDEYLVFACLAFVTALHACSVAAAYYATCIESASLLRVSIDSSTTTGIAALALALDFALRHAGVAVAERTRRGLYGLAAVFIVGVLFDFWWVSGPTYFPPLRLFGLAIPIVRLEVTTFAATFYVLVVVGVSVMAGLLGRAWWRSRTSGLAAFLGSIVLAAAAVNDGVGLGMGLFDSASLLPLGFGALIYGVSVTLLARYGALTSALRTHTKELRGRSRELEDALAELEHTAEKLVRQERLAVVGQLASRLGSNAQEPIAKVVAAVERMRRSDRQLDATAAVLRDIDNEVRKLELFVNDLLRHARPRPSTLAGGPEDAGASDAE